MRIALLFVLACSSPSKPEPATPTEAPPEPMFEKTPPSSQPRAPVEPISNEDLEAPAKPASGEQAKIAWQSNRDGIALAKAGNYDEALGKFRDAVARVPAAPYFYNLCYALHQLGRFDEALVACDAVDNNEPSINVKLKTERLTARVLDDAKAQQIEITR